MVRFHRPSVYRGTIELAWYNGLDATINGFKDLNGRVNDLVDYNGVEYKTTPAKPAEKKLVKKAAKK